MVQEEHVLIIVVAYNKIINCGMIGSYHTTDGLAINISNLQYYNNVVIQTVLQYTKPGVLFYGPRDLPGRNACG